MKEEKMEARKSIRETFDTYQERSKNDRPKRVGDIGDKSHGEKLLDAFVVNMAKLESQKNLKHVEFPDIEMTNGDHIIYGIDEIGSILGLYGKDSEIYNAMAEGKVVSPMVEKSMKKNKEVGNEETAKREESLLARCLKREQEKGLGI